MSASLESSRLSYAAVSTHFLSQFKFILMLVATTLATGSLHH